MIFNKRLLIIILYYCVQITLEINENQQYSSLFVVETDVAVREIPYRQWTTLEDRWNEILRLAFKLSNSAHLRQNLSSSEWTLTSNESNPFTTKILEAENVRGIVKLKFVCFFNHKPVESEVIVNDVSFLTLSHISAILQYPVINIKASYEISKKEENQIWIIGIIIGSGLITVLCGWCLLCVYYNTCGRPLSRYRPDSGDVIEEEKFPKNKNPKIAQITVAKESESALFPGPSSFEKPKNNTEKAIQTTLEKTEVTVSEPISEETPVVTPVMSPELPSSPKMEVTVESDSERPKSADVKKKPKKIDDGRITVPEEPIHRWSPYDPGDFVAATYSVGYMLKSEKKINPYALPLLPQYRIHKHQRHLMNLWIAKEKKNENELPEPMERLRRSSYLPYGVLSTTPSRRSASHPCRWKLCGAHFGYHSVRRF